MAFGTQPTPTGLAEPPIDDLMEHADSKYALAIFAAKRARQIIGGEEPFVDGKGKKPLSIAIQELEQGLIKIMPEDDDSSDEMDAERAVLHADHYNEEMAAERAAEDEE